MYYFMHTISWCRMIQPTIAPWAEVRREKRRLTEAIIAAIDEISNLSQREISAVMNFRCLDEIHQIEAEFAQAARFKASLIERYDGHVRAHGC